MGKLKDGEWHVKPHLVRNLRSLNHQGIIIKGYCGYTFHTFDRSLDVPLFESINSALQYNLEARGVTIPAHELTTSSRLNAHPPFALYSHPAVIALESEFEVDSKTGLNIDDPAEIVCIDRCPKSIERKRSLGVWTVAAGGTQQSRTPEQEWTMACSAPHFYLDESKHDLESICSAIGGCTTLAPRIW